MLETTEQWPAIERAVKTRGIKDVAAEFGVSPGAITAALLRTSTSRDPVQAPGAPPPPTRSKAAPEVSTVMVNGLECRAGTKDEEIAALKDRLGVEPDAVIAQQVGVSVRTVATFRRKHGIAGRRGRGPSKAKKRDGLPPEKASKPRGAKAPKAGAKKKKKGKPRGRKSKIDAFADQVGTRPDREIAELAGVSTNAVVAYRRRRGIPSARAAGTAARQAAEAQAPQTPAKARAKAQAKPRPAKPSSGARVYRVELAAGGAAFVVADSLVHAAQQAQGHEGVVGVSLAGDLLG